MQLRDPGERLVECVKQESCQEMRSGQHLANQNRELHGTDQSEASMQPFPNEPLGILGQYGQDRGCVTLSSICDIKDESVMLENKAKLKMNSSLIFCIVSALILSANGLGVEVRLTW